MRRQPKGKSDKDEVERKRESQKVDRERKSKVNELTHTHVNSHRPDAEQHTTRAFR